jgi:hypothetical protein
MWLLLLFLVFTSRFYLSVEFSVQSSCHFLYIFVTYCTYWNPLYYNFTMLCMLLNMGFIKITNSKLLSTSARQITVHSYTKLCANSQCLVFEYFSEPQVTCLALGSTKVHFVRGNKASSTNRYNRVNPSTVDKLRLCLKPRINLGSEHGRMNYKDTEPYMSAFL